MKILRTSLLTLLAVAGAWQLAAELPPVERILFVGNSLTYVNDLPGTVSTIAREAGTSVEVGMVAGPNLALEDHWGGKAIDEIRSGRWTTVVMQQGPSSQPASRAHLIEWSRRFAGAIRDAGARPALMGVWPSETRVADFPRSVESYRLAAERCDCLLIPAGEAWTIVIEANPDIQLYGPDRFHPSPAGTWLAALTAWAVITDADPLIDLPLEATTSAPVEEDDRRRLVAALAKLLDPGSETANRQ